MKMKKQLALFLALATIFTLTACGGKSGGQDDVEASSGGEPTTLIFANRSDPGNYGPYGSSSDRKMYQTILFETLLFANSEGGIENVLLKNYEAKGGGVYRLELYDYIKDTEGNPLTASDIEFSFNKAIENGTYATVLACFDHFEIINDYTLDMYLNDERAGTFNSICCAIRIVTEKAWNDSGDDMTHNAVGTSPYRLKEYVEGSYVLYEKTNNYWQTDESLIATCSQANSDYVKWVNVTDNSAGAVALQNGEIDHSKSVNSSDYGLFMDDNMNGVNGYHVAALVNPMTYGITFNCGENSVCSSLELRQAICYAIDTEAIAANIFGNIAEAAGNYINRAYADYDESLEDLENYYRYDEAKAADLLKASGYNGETVKILVSPQGQGKNIGTLIQGFLLAANIQCELLTYESAIYSSYLYEETGTEWDMALTADTSSTGTEYMWSVLYANDNTLNSFGSLQHIKDDKLQALYEEMASVEGNSTESLGAFLDYVKENCYQYGIMNFYKLSFGGQRLEKFVVDATGEVVSGACVLKSDTKA